VLGRAGRQQHRQKHQKAPHVTQVTVSGTKLQLAAIAQVDRVRRLRHRKACGPRWRGGREKGAARRTLGSRLKSEEQRPAEEAAAAVRRRRSARHYFSRGLPGARYVHRLCRSLSAHLIAICIIRRVQKCTRCCVPLSG